MGKMTKVLCTLMIVITMVGLAGCGSKERMTGKAFQHEMESKGFTVVDITDSTTDGRFLQVLEAFSDDEKFAFEFYFLRYLNCMT